MAPAKKAAAKKTAAKTTAAKKTTAKKTAAKTTAAKKTTAKKTAAKKTAAKKTAAKKTTAAGSGGTENVIVASKLREVVRGQEIRMSSDFVEGLNREVHALVGKAVQRAKANKRGTVRPEDL